MYLQLYWIIYESYRLSKAQLGECSLIWSVKLPERFEDIRFIEYRNRDYSQYLHTP